VDGGWVDLDDPLQLFKFTDAGYIEIKFTTAFKDSTGFTRDKYWYIGHEFNDLITMKCDDGFIFVNGVNKGQVTEGADNYSVDPWDSTATPVGVYDVIFDVTVRIYGDGSITIDWDGTSDTSSLSISLPAGTIPTTSIISRITVGYDPTLSRPDGIYFSAMEVTSNYEIKKYQLTYNNKPLKANNKLLIYSKEIIKWIPDIPTELWLDASDSSTITEGGGFVSQWDDKSGNNRDLIQTTGSAQLVTGDDTINGLNVLVGVDNTQYMTNAAPFTVKYIIGVFQQKDISAPNVIVLGSASDRVNGDFLIYGATNLVSFDGNGLKQGKYRLNAGTQSVSAENHTVTGSTDVRMLDGLYGDTIQMNQLGSLSVASFGMSDTDLLAEVIQLSAEPDEATRQKIEGYLAWKWGLEDDLPVGHPYKNEQPLE